MEIDLDKYTEMTQPLRKYAEKIINRITKQPLYHYTHPFALKNIIETNQLHITSSQFMNDKNETIHFIKLLKEVLSIEETFSEVKSERIDDYRNAFYKIINNWFYSLSENTYILSTSLNGNSIGLWLAYNDGKGYTLEFDGNELINNFNEKFSYIINYGKVIYDNKTKIAIIKTIVEKIMKIYEFYEKETEKIIDYDNVPWDGSTLSLIYSIACLMKEETFSYEEEYRIIIINPDREISISSGYKIKNSILTPYIKINLELDRLLQSIIIGPLIESELADTGLMGFLKYKNLNKVSVKNSGIEVR